ncbi:MAG: glycerol-3-phosphate acyltransferase [bacterium]|nr:glycerol-3-phosphate acyltransferase [bacterium]
MAIKITISVLSSYILGSILPAYFLGKLLKGIDIREVGDKNAGTINAYKTLGPIPALFTAIFDLSKGMLSAWIAHLVGIEYPLNILISFAAVLGHVFPFYLKFRGGQGEATATGIILYFLLRTLFTKPDFLTAFLILVFYSLILLYIIGPSRILGLYILPAVFLLVAVHLSTLEWIIMLVFVAYTFSVSLSNRIKSGYKLSEQTRKTIKWSRFVARPFAILYIIIYFQTSKGFILKLTGTVALAFLIFDLVRLSKAGINRAIMKTLSFAFKSKEEKTFSSMTHFTVASFLSYLLFPGKIASCSILYPVFGDMFAKLMGLEYGRRRFFEKTLEGFLAYTTFGIIAGYIYSKLANYPFPLTIIGALVGAISEILPWKLDDNLSGSLFSGLAMFYVGKLLNWV